MSVKTVLLAFPLNKKEQPCPSPQPPPPPFLSCCRHSAGHPPVGLVRRGLFPLTVLGFSLPSCPLPKCLLFPQGEWGACLGLERSLVRWSSFDRLRGELCAQGHPGASSSRLPNSHSALLPARPRSEDTQPHSAQVMAQEGWCLLCAILGFVPAPSGTAPPHSQRQDPWGDPFAIALGNEDRRCLRHSQQSPSLPPSNQVSDLTKLWPTFYSAPTPDLQGQTYTGSLGKSLEPGATMSMEASGPLPPTQSLAQGWVCRPRWPK